MSPRIAHSQTFTNVADIEDHAFNYMHIGGNSYYKSYKHFSSLRSQLRLIFYLCVVPFMCVKMLHFLFVCYQQKNDSSLI